MAEINEYNALMHKLKDLYQQLSDIYDKIDGLDKAREQSYSNMDYTTLDKIIIKGARDKLFKQEYTLRESIYTIENDLFWIVPPIKSNGLIEIRRVIDGRDINQDNITGHYSICLAKNRKVVGNISYRGYHFDEYFGDVGYSIDNDFRGNNYSYYALCMLGELLREKGIENFWITTYKSNIPSVKTIEKYGGVPIKENENHCLYIAETIINDKHLEEKRTK